MRWRRSASLARSELAGATPQTAVLTDDEVRALVGLVKEGLMGPRQGSTGAKSGHVRHDGAAPSCHSGGR